MISTILRRGTLVVARAGKPERCDVQPENGLKLPNKNMAIIKVNGIKSQKPFKAEEGRARKCYCKSFKTLIHHSLRSRQQSVPMKVSIKINATFLCL